LHLVSIQRDISVVLENADVSKLQSCIKNNPELSIDQVAIAVICAISCSFM